MKKLLAVLASLAIASWSFAAQAADEVKLLKVRTTSQSYRGYWEQGRFDVVVANLGYAKQVNIHVKRKDGSWADFPLSYTRPAGVNSEIWSADYNLYSLPTDATELEFAVKYDVNGQTYWDNNNWANFKLSRNAGDVLFNNTNVLNTWFNAESYVYANTLNGAVTLKNLGPVKSVKVVYSTDGWKTSKTAWGSFDPSFWNSSYSSVPNPNLYGFENWRFQLDVTGATQVEYAIEYTVNGQTYWDNNFGRNYLTRLISAQ